MSWINKYLSEADLARIEASISKVEETTSGEIVPVIVRRSSAVGHVPLTLTLLLTLFLIIVEFPFSDWLWVTPWVYLWPVIVVIFFGLSQVLAKSKWIQKVFVPEKDELDSVHRRAHLEFYLNRIHRTESGTGVLIFVSVMEKKAVVLADEGISKKLPKEHWDEILGMLGKQLHDGKWADGFVAAIEACGKDLQTHFPTGAGNSNQLKNHLIVKDY
ncbi:TPM domain-containing protein [Bdellovibrio bacteriovorus]|uniref:TPM domain-containing protein n=1 Tax=Bdellovibrio bacteriovorus TaxID=959 RepID=UPI003AA8BBE6